MLRRAMLIHLTSCVGAAVLELTNSSSPATIILADCEITALPNGLLRSSCMTEHEADLSRRLSLLEVRFTPPSAPSPLAPPPPATGCKDRSSSGIFSDAKYGTYFCDCDIDPSNGCWMLLTVNGDTSSQACDFLVSSNASGCGSLKADLTADWQMEGKYQAALSWSQAVVVTYSSSYPGSKTGYMALDFGSEASTQETRKGTPLSISGTGDLVTCDGGRKWVQYSKGHVCTSGCCGSVMSSTVFNMQDASWYLGSRGPASGGMDDLTGGCGCSNRWGSAGSVVENRKGDKSAFFVR